MVATGLQFVTPLLVIIGVHLIWLICLREYKPGFSKTIFQRSVHTTVGITVVVFVAHIFAPNPAFAGGGGEFSGFLGVIFCLAILAAGLAIAAIIIHSVFVAARYVTRQFRKGKSDNSDTMLFDFASVVVAIIALTVSSLEGLPSFYSFSTTHQSTATRFVTAEPKHVWRIMEEATSPDFPLPEILNVFPRPTKILTDEGTSLGAHRRVEFSGREGVGVLSMRVVERDQAHAVFSVLSDTSPYGQWIGYKKLTYYVLPEIEGTRVSVELEFDRKLAPAWFFSPLMRGAAYLAMDVLARDVATRAEM